MSKKRKRKAPPPPKKSKRGLVLAFIAGAVLL